MAGEIPFLDLAKMRQIVQTNEQFGVSVGIGSETVSTAIGKILLRDPETQQNASRILLELYSAFGTTAVNIEIQKVKLSTLPVHAGFLTAINAVILI